MTMTIKLAPEMEQRLRQRSRRLGKPASVLIREALAAYLESHPADEQSAYALGADLFGRHRGAADLASSRKHALIDAWTAKHMTRQAGRRRA